MKPANDTAPTLFQLLALSVLVEDMLGREAAARVFKVMREEMKRQEKR